MGRICYNKIWEGRKVGTNVSGCTIYFLHESVKHKDHELGNPRQNTQDVKTLKTNFSQYCAPMLQSKDNEFRLGNANPYSRP